MSGLHACIIIFQPALKQMFDDNQCKILMIYDQEFTFLLTTRHPWIEFVNTIFRPSLLRYLMLCRQPDADMILSKQLQIVTKPIKHLVSFDPTALKTPSLLSEFQSCLECCLLGLSPLLV